MPQDTNTGQLAPSPLRKAITSFCCLPFDSSWFFFLKGVTLLEQGEAGPVPAALQACTEKV